jgi:hypothetical protein
MNIVTIPRCIRIRTSTICIIGTSTISHGTARNRIRMRIGMKRWSIVMRTFPTSTTATATSAGPIGMIGAGPAALDRVIGVPLRRRLQISMSRRIQSVTEPCCGRQPSSLRASAAVTRLFEPNE